MKLYNKTKKVLVAEKVMIRKSLIGLIIGLTSYKKNNNCLFDFIKSKKFTENDAMIFKVRGRSGVHGWFMSFPILVVFLDKEMKVIEMARLEPFKYYKPQKDYECFIELDEKKAEKIRLGDKLELK